MRRGRKHVTGVRRDDGVRVIRSSEVRYPGINLPPVENLADDGTIIDPERRLAPARDTGIAVEGRGAREARRAARRQRNVVLWLTLAISGLLLAAIGWRYSSDVRAASTPLFAETTSTTSGFSLVSSRADANERIPRFSAPRPKATPMFATYGSLKIRLPVPVGRLTEVGFHQAAYPYALHMKTPLKDANLEEVRRTRTTGREASTQPTGEDAVLTGKVLRMWRDRPGKPDTAADVGARPGTPVLAPVDGTVVKVKWYKLYGKWTDLEIHIQPTGRPDLDMVLIHVQDAKVAPGDEVRAGITQIGAVRKLSDKLTDQLGEFVRGGGDHVHIQLNNARYSGYKGLDGAIDPETDDVTSPSETSTTISE